VRFVREHFAEPGVVVTESKMLCDAVMDIEREVDIVIEGEFDGDRVTTSIEVIEHKRKADVAWVEGMIAKHEHLPTNRLVLVSKSGFTQNALRRVIKTGGKVEALTPKMVTVAGKPVVQSLFVGRVALRPTKCAFLVGRPDGTTERIVALPDIQVFDAEGQEIGTAAQLAQDVLNLHWLVDQFLRMARDCERGDEIGGFSCRLPIVELEYLLHHDDTDEFHLIGSIELSGEARYTQDEMSFQLAELGSRQYAAGEGVLMGRPAVWVGSTDHKRKVTRVSWKVDDKTLPPTETSTQPVFARVGELRPPTEWKDALPSDSPATGTLIAYMEGHTSGDGVTNTKNATAED